MSNEKNIEFRRMQDSDDDLLRFRNCFRRNVGDKDIDHLRWQYLETPPGKFYVDFAVDGQPPEEQLAAIYATFPVRFNVDGDRVLAVQSLDTLVDKDYRRQGLFTRTAQSLFKSAEDDGVAFVYGFPNALSAGGFFGKLGWESLDPVPFLIKPLRLNYFIKRLTRLEGVVENLPDIPLSRRTYPELPENYEIKDQMIFGPEFSDVWREFSRDIPVAIERDAEYLTWRFIENPREYEMVSLYHGPELVGYVVFCVRKKHSGKIGYIMEFVFLSEHEKQCQGLLRKAVSEMACRGCDLLLAWNFSHSPNHKSYLVNKFFPLPRFLRPIELHIGVRPLASSRQGLLKERANWYISYCDSDTV